MHSPYRKEEVFDLSFPRQIMMSINTLPILHTPNPLFDKEMAIQGAEFRIPGEGQVLHPIISELYYSSK